MTSDEWVSMKCGALLLPRQRVLMGPLFPCMAKRPLSVFAPQGTNKPLHNVQRQVYRQRIRRVTDDSPTGKKYAKPRFCSRKAASSFVWFGAFFVEGRGCINRRWLSLQLKVSIMVHSVESRRSLRDFWKQRPLMFACFRVSRRCCRHPPSEREGERETCTNGSFILSTVHLA